MRLDVHAFDNDTIVYHNVTARQTTVVLPANETYPHGICETGPLADGNGPNSLTFDGNSTELLTTGEYLGFKAPTVLPKYIPGHDNARWVPNLLCLNFGQWYLALIWPLGRYTYSKYMPRLLGSLTS